MMATSKFDREITQLLENAQDSQLVAVMEMIDQLQSRSSFEGQIDAIRPKLALLRPPRPISFKRVVATPFEDLLVADQQWQTDSLTISRRKLSPILDEARKDFTPDQLQEIETRMRPHKMSDIRSVCEIGKEIWEPSRDRILEAAREKQKSNAAEAEQFRNAAAMISIAGLICPLLEFLPARPMGDLSAYQITAIKNALRECERRSIEEFTSGIQWLVARSFKPLVILKLLIKGEIGTSIAGRQDLAHRIASQVLRRQRMALIHFDLADDNMTAIMESVETAAGSFLSIAERARDFDMTESHTKPTGDVLRELIMRILRSALTDNYFKTIDVLDNSQTTDGEVEKIEAEARAVQRVIALAEACGLKQDAMELIEVAGENAAAELRGRYGASANPMTVVDQIRTFECIFGGDQARKLWQEFSRRRKTAIGEVAAAAKTAAPAQAMIAALNLK